MIVCGCVPIVESWKFLAKITPSKDFSFQRFKPSRFVRSTVEERFERIKGLICFLRTKSILSMDRSWMWYRRDKHGHITNEFKNGVIKFLNFAFSHENSVFSGKIKCSCSKCKYSKILARDEVHIRLYKSGFIQVYDNWILHGESCDIVFNDFIDEDEFICEEAYETIGTESSRMRDLIMDLTGPQFDWTPTSHDQISNREAQKFFSLLKAADEPLYAGCNKLTKLSKSFTAHEEDMKKEQDREISEIELYERTNRSKQGLGEYSCRKAKVMREMYDNLMEEKYSSDPTPMSPFDPNIWREAKGGVIKGRVYGLGSQDPYAILGNAAVERGSKAKQRESYTYVEEYSNKSFAHLEKIVDQMKSRNEQLESQQRAMVSILESYFPDAVRRMLQDIQCTNHSHAGRSGHQEQEFIDSIHEVGRHGRSDCDNNRNDNRNNMRNSDRHNRDEDIEDMSE